MKIDSIEKVLPCPSDPNKFRVIAHLDEKPDYSLLYENLKEKEGFVCSYSKRLDMLMISLKNIEMKFFSSGQVVIRRVDDVEEAKSILMRLLKLASDVLEESKVN